MNLHSNLNSTGGNRINRIDWSKHRFHKILQLEQWQMIPFRRNDDGIYLKSQITYKSKMDFGHYHQLWKIKLYSVPQIWTWTWTEQIIYLFKGIDVHIEIKCHSVPYLYIFIPTHSYATISAAVIGCARGDVGCSGKW